MSSRVPAPTTTPTRTRPTFALVGGLLATAAIVVAVGLHLVAPSSSSPSTTDPIRPTGSHVSIRPSSLTLAPSTAPPPREQRKEGGPLGEADGAVPDGTTVFDDEVPAVGKLDADLRGALHAAARDAVDDGIAFSVNSGWRSPAYQEQLLREAVAEHGSEEEAARWVATPERSEHVAGNAIDVGPPEAAAWLADHGAEHGLCRVYRNEPWHFELRPEAADHGCPPLYADPTEDPRMHG